MQGYCYYINTWRFSEDSNCLFNVSNDSKNKRKEQTASKLFIAWR